MMLVEFWDSIFEGKERKGKKDWKVKWRRVKEEIDRR